MPRSSHIKQRAMIEAASLRAADEGLRGKVVDTPLVESRILARLTGARSVRVKLETFQHTGSFKFRGALWRCMQLDEIARRTGVVAYSSGNFGRGLFIWAAKRVFSRPV